MKRRFILGITVGFIFIGVVNAQPGGDNGGGPDPTNPAPFGGLEYLLLAGGALGVKKIISKRKKEQ